MKINLFFAGILGIVVLATVGALVFLLPKKAEVPIPDQQMIKSVEFNKPVTLRVTDKVVFPDGLNLSVKEINDSRCKAGVQCIWAGELSPVLVAENGKMGTSSEEIRLGTINNKTASVKGYEFALESATENDATIIVSIIPPVKVLGSITGYLHLGPVCPVQKNPPDPNCADKTYVDAKVDIKLKSSGVLAKSLVSDASGNFRADLAPGVYTISAGPKAGGFLPRCAESEATVTANHISSVDISCDTGIR